MAAAWRLGGVDLLVHNASALGAEPLVRLEELPLQGLRRALEVNLVAALGLVQEALPLLRSAAAGAGAGGQLGRRGGRRIRRGAGTGRPRRPWTSWRGGAGGGGAGAEGVGGRSRRHGDGPVRGGRTGRRRSAAEPADVAPAFLRLLDERPASGRYGAPALLEERR
ncbi:hypothetical protein GCM10023238_02690 [Streptomyces heliomycini]